MQAGALCFADFTWLNGNSRVPRNAVRYQVLYAGNPRRCRLHLRLQPSQGRHHQRLERDFPLQRISTDPVRRRRRLPLGQCARPVMTQFGMYSQTTPRNDASPARGQWNLADAYRYVSEAYGATTSMRSTGSTSMPASSCPTSACSATTTSTTGPISRPMCLRIRRGSSTACGCRSFPTSTQD